MSGALLSAIITALMSIGGKLAGAAFLEAVATKVIIWSLEKIAPMTTNKLDDELVELVKKRLGAESV